MAIRFQCPACSEPIEVDDSWAQQVVRCPYCQRTITAPAESTLPTPDSIRTAAPMRPTFEVPRPGESRMPGPTLSLPATDNISPSNRPATAALILAIAMIALLVLALVIMSNRSLDLMELQEEINKARAAGSSGLTAMTQYLEKHGGSMPSWLVAIGIIEMGVLGAWVAAVILGVIGLFRPYRRAAAVSALVISGLVGVMFCMGIAASFG